MPRCGANALRQAVHPSHGLAWTDGRRVMLACLRLRSAAPYKGGRTDTAGDCDDDDDDDDSQRHPSLFAAGVGASSTTGPVPPASTTSCSLLDSSIIGTFEHVWDLCWGASCCPGSAALLAVQHKRHATVWLLRRVGQLPSDPAAKGYDPCANLLVSQTCEVAVRQRILPQGCVWHPNSDALAVLTDGEAWLLTAARQGNSRIRVPLPHHHHHRQQQQQHQRPHQLRHPCCPQAVRCAAWSDGGRRLVVAAGASIFLYEWDEARRSLSPSATCPIFHLGGFASAALPVGGSLLAVALEAPGLAAVAAAPTPWPHNKTAGRRLASSQVSLARGVEPGIQEMKALPGHPRHRSSADFCHCVESANSLAVGPPPSTLLLVSFDGSSHGTCATRRVLMPGLAVPDLVAFEPRSATLALASNAAGLVLLFTLGPLGSVVASGSVRLASEEKVKGVCFFDDRTLLLASGRLCQGDAPLVLSSPPSSTSSPEPFSYTSKYSLRILARDLPTPRAAEDERSTSIQSTVSSSRSSLNYMQARRGPAAGTVECLGGETSLGEVHRVG
ncbi:WD repeat and coiled-coil-containing protein-like [Petromyzon marinus]|uniref:WD repeat and coiled-coil-containing protein-like n=1 Tax=Petromyzon marinus TaxID=7757 RepID=UPI003F6FC9D2